MASELRVNTLKDASGNNSVGMSYVASGSAKVWADINNSGSSLRDSFNVSSLDDDGTGEYGLNLTNNMGSANYSAQSSITFSHTTAVNNIRVAAIESQATNAVEVDSGYGNASSVFISYDIETNACVAVNGDLA